MKGDNHRQYIPLFASGGQATQTQDDSEIELSDFPPIRERKSTPPPPPYSRPPRSRAAQEHSQQPQISSEEEPPPNQLRRHRQQIMGLGQTNILNTVDATAPGPAQHAEPKSSFKRESGIPGMSDERPLKKRRLALRGEDNMRWVRHEIAGIKERIERIAVEARDDRQDISSKLQELLRRNT